MSMVFKPDKLYTLITTDHSLSLDSPSISLIINLCEIGLGLKLNENNGLSEEIIKEYLEEDYKSREAARKREERARKRASGRNNCVSGHSKNASGRNVSGQSSKASAKHGKSPVSGDCSDSSHVRTPAAEEYIIINTTDNMDICNNGDTDSQRAEAFNLIWNSWPVGKQGKRSMAIRAFLESNLTLEDVKNKVLPAITYLKSKWDSIDFAPWVKTFLEDRQYEGYIPKLDDQSSKQSYEDNRCNLEERRKDHPEMFGWNKSWLDLDRKEV